jgi:hypothetical protein
MDLHLAKPLPQLLLLLRRNLLVSQKDDAALSYQQCKLVPLHIRQILQLQSLNLRADIGRQVRDFCGSLE